jgi:lipoprotein NlpD
MLRVLGVIAVVALAGCGSSPPVPVVDANPPVVVEGGRAVPSASRQGVYVIKRGDNLFRIAKAHGVSTQDLLRWNNLSDETRIEVGQALKVVPPDGGDVEVRPIVASSPIIVVGDGASSGAMPPVTVGSSVGTTATPATTAAVPTVNGPAQQREPRGGKIPWSETALTQVRAMDSSLPQKPAEAPPAAAAGAPTVPAPAPAPANGESGSVDWTWPVAGKVIRGFGKNNGGEISRGIDIAGRKGEPIQASAAGKVSFVGTLDKYGDFVVVRHEADYLSVYAHTSKILVKRDQMVGKGQKIAEVGSSGTDQPKLHFEIRHKSEPVDPIKLLPPRQ